MYLKGIQIIYQIKYKFRKPASLKRVRKPDLKSEPLSLCEYPVKFSFIAKKGEFYHVRFLNLDFKFQNKIDWTFNGYGKLWNYHLQYADFLKQDDLTVTERLDLINDLYNGLFDGSPIPEPFPASLRIMNVIRFLSMNDLQKMERESLESAVYSELCYLVENLEFHILGNHLLENAFALHMGGYYFGDVPLIDKAEEILMSELNEQVLSDGGHFERSPMYHNIILFRVLEGISYLRNENETLVRLRNKARAMAGWMLAMQFNDESVPHFNDSIDGVALKNSEILQLAKKLNIWPIVEMELKDSGYRKYSFGKFEIFVDLNGIEPSYQPGHSHADSLSFQLGFNKKPFLIDPGVSTYAIGERRNWERSTMAHNTVTVDGRNSADMWGSFRVGKRPEIFIEKELQNLTIARINTGYYEHIRKFKLSSSKISIEDQIRSRGSKAIANFYLHPSIEIVEVNKDVCIFSNGCKLQTDSDYGITIESYLFAKEFNHLIKGMKCSVHFDSICTTEIIGA